MQNISLAHTVAFTEEEEENVHNQYNLNLNSKANHNEPQRNTR
jgi:hypothetical protein